MYLIKVIVSIKSYLKYEQLKDVDGKKTLGEMVPSEVTQFLRGGNFSLKCLKTSGLKRFDASEREHTLVQQGFFIALFS